MLKALTGRRSQDPDIADSLKTLQADTLRVLVVLTAIAYLAWHFLSLILDPELIDSGRDLSDRWLLVPIVLLGLSVTWLCRRWVSVASFIFLVSSVFSLAVAVALLRAPVVAFLLPLVMLVAVMLLRLVGGLLVGTATLVAFGIGYLLGPLRIIPDNVLIMVAVVAALAATVAFVLDRNILLAVEWSQHSAAQAHRNEAEARRHRAELVQALHQLGDANHRLYQANAALEAAWKVADAAERAKSEFVTNISHELRTPLNLIAGFSELIMTSPESYGVPLPPRYRSDVQTIYRSAQHLLELTNDVLDLARIGIGHLSLSREPVDLRHLIEDSTAIVKDYLAAKHLWLKLDLEPGLLLSVDRLRIRQVMLNLLTNAARFTEEGGVTVSTRLTDDRVVIRVTDTGPGIPVTEQQRIFEAFHQVDRAGSAAWGHGYGLGLAISQHLIELHGGHMGVESTLGSGTSFWLTLPVDNNRPDATTGADRPSSLSWLARHGERVLVIITDDSEFVEFLQRHLPSYRILIAPNAAAAVALAQQLCAVALLTDYADDQREHVLLASLNTPVLRLPFPRAAPFTGASGVTAYLTKPVRRQKLLQAITRVSGPVQTIVVADDDPEFVQLIERFLRGFEATARARVLVAYTGEEALALLQRERVDLLLLDLAMPQRDGQEVLRAINGEHRDLDIPIIIVSAREWSAGSAPLIGSLVLNAPGGFHLEEFLVLLEALLGALPPLRPRAAGQPVRHLPLPPAMS
ncbi:MAG: ATP-binding protein [Chloroflexi bacterium]|nr:ATP-binding protein [Chloroflexota bacterium]